MQPGELLRQSLCPRRVMLGAPAALCAWTAPAGAQDRTSEPQRPVEQDPTSEPPRPGDHFVFLVGPKQGAIIRGSDLRLGEPQVQAYPADPSGVVKNGSRLNLVIIIRIGSDGASKETMASAADGVVAYSGVCTHQGCPVNMWSDDRKALVCSCHGSVYDPKDGAEVLEGPAPRPLPQLALRVENDVLLVASGFSARVGV
jgi:rieske iron-sulfur protein